MSAFAQANKIVQQENSENLAKFIDKFFLILNSLWIIIYRGEKCIQSKCISISLSRMQNKKQMKPSKKETKKEENKSDDKNGDTEAPENLKSSINMPRSSME